MAPMTILFTSTDRACRYIVSTLLSSPRCPAIRILAPSSVKPEETFPSQLLAAPHSIVVADHYEGPTFLSAFENVNIVFHDGAMIHPKEDARAFAIIEAAKGAKVEHFILSSIFQPVRTKIQTHKLKIGIEEYLVESRLNYTILQPPPHYMQNVPLDAAMRTGEIPIGFSASVVHGFLDIADYAAVARIIMSNPTEHNYARYELIGQNICYNDIARTISKVTGKEVHCSVFTVKEFLTKMMASATDKSEYTQDVFERMLRYYDRWGIAGNLNVLRWLLKREPTSWEGYLKRELRSNKA